MSEFIRDRTLDEQRRRHPPRRIFFPPNPPPSGVPLEFDPGTYVLGAAPKTLSGEVMEPFFAPLSTRLIESDEPIGQAAKRQLAGYQKTRDELLAALRRTVIALIPADRAARLTEFSNLARDQTPKLQKLEAQADKLRAELARGIGWSDWRTWQLGRGVFDRPRPENRVLEHQVLRAAAFYQEGLGFAQRRLLREAVQIMEEAVFRGGDDTPSPTRLFPFFSPDLARVALPPDTPADVAAAFARHRTEKDALRTEIQDAVYANDRVSAAVRTRTLRRLTDNQSPRLTALEALAETIRGDLALMPAAWRRPAPQLLPADLEKQIDEYLEIRRGVQRDCEAFVRPVATVRPPAGIHNDVEALATWREEHRAEVQAATDEFLATHTAELEDLNRRCRAINAQLAPYLRPEEVGFKGDSLDKSLMEFLLRYRQEIAYYEYDVAVFEPGLSPEQRRLLFAGAIARLELPLGAPDRQAVAAPRTLLR